MLETYCRPVYQRWVVEPVARRLKSWSNGAIWITLLGCLFGIGAAIAIAWARPGLAVLLLLLSGYCDTLDGTLARLTNTSSAVGSMLDILADRVVEFAIILGLFYVDSGGRAGLCLWMLGAIMLCVCAFLLVGVFVEKAGSKSFYYSPGLMERAEAFGFFILMILIPQWFSFLSMVFTFLVLYTAVAHIFSAIKSINYDKQLMSGGDGH